MSDQLSNAALREAARLSDKSLPDRETALDELQSTDPGLAGEVRRLLALSDDRTEAGVEVSSMEASQDIPGLPDVPGFQVESLIGRGGMGSVYRARQDDPRRTVALKVIRPDLMSPELARRFANEGDLLARLEHPGIARIYQAGTREKNAGESVHFLAMEYVEGEDLVRYVREHGPSQTSRVELMAQIARAVQHAHQRGVIHRDLKPSNILIDQHHHPRILDFGVARAVDDDAGNATMLTSSGELVGTLAYMAPEQIEGRSDTRTDVYALGVILYQLLSDALPHDISGLSLLEAIRRIGDTPTTPIRQRIPGLPRGLETIVNHALNPDPDRRYGSAGELAADLENWLGSRPLIAKPPGALESLGLFARRHKLAMAGIAVVALALIAAVAVSTRYAISEANARLEAETRSEQLSKVNEFLANTLSAADPEQSQGRDITVGELLDDARRNLDQEQLSPLIDAELRTVIAKSYVGLGQYDAARQALESVLETLEAAPGDTRDAEIDARLLLARVISNQGEQEAALAELDSLVAKIDAAHGDDPARLAELNAGLTSIRSQALVETSQFEAAIELLEPAIEAAAAAIGRTHEATMTLKNNLAQSYYHVRRFDEHDAIMEELIVDRTETLGPDHPHTLISRNSLANSMAQRGEFAAAEERFRELLPDRIDVLGVDHPGTNVTRNNLVIVLVQQGKLEEAEPLGRQVLDTNMNNVGPAHPLTLGSRNTLAYIIEDQGRLDDAEILYREILTGIAASGQIQPDLIAVRNNLAMLLMNTERYAESEEQFDVLLSETAEALGNEHPYYAVFENNYGELLGKMGRTEEAREVLKRSGDAIEKVFGAEHARTEKARGRLAALDSPAGNKGAD